MEWPSFFRVGKSGQTVLIVDIKSGSVGASIVQISEDHKPVIFESARMPISFGERLDFKQFTSTMLETLESVIKHLPQDKVRSVHNIHCFFSSPWCVSAIKQIKKEGEKPFTVSKEYIQGVVRSEQDRFKELVEKQRSADGESESMPIEHTVVETRINGYPTDNPDGHETKTFSMTLVLGVVSKSVSDKVSRILSQLVGSQEVEYHSFILVMFTTVRELFDTHEHFMLVDVGGEITDVVLVREGVPVALDSFPVGRDVLIKKTAVEANVIPEEIEGSLTHESIKEKTDISTYSETNEWSAGFQETVLSFGNRNILPRTIFIAASNDVGPWISKSLSNNEFSDTDTQERQKTAILLGGNMAREHYVCERGVDCDLFLALESLFIEKLDS